jgi:hypothetical protein
LACDYLSLTLNRWGWMGASHIVNTHTIDARVGGRSRYPGRASRGPVVDVGGSIAEADRLRRAGALPQALQVLGRTVDLAPAGADRMEVCTARRMLAEVMCEMGDRTGACEVLTELLADAQKSFGPCHPASVRSLAVLAAVVHELADYDTAERLYREVGERIGDRASRAGSLVRVRLALLQRDRGNIDTAREEMTEAYQKHREAFGAEDADTVSIAAQLAELHRDAGDSAAARRVLTVAYVAACSSLGEDHELTRNLETDLEALEAPMPSAPVDLPEDSQSTRSIKRRHSKKGVPAAAAAAPARASAAPVRAAATPAAPAGVGALPGAPSNPAPFPPAPASPAPFRAAPASPAPFPPAPAGLGAFSAAPASPAPFRPAPAGLGAFPAAPASPAAYPAAPASPAAYPAAPASPAPYPAAPASPAPYPAAPASPAAYPAAPASPAPYPAAPASPAAFAPGPTRVSGGSARTAATYAAASARPAASAPARTAQIPAQARRSVQPEPGLSGRRTQPAYGEQLSSERFAALAAAETVVTAAVADPARGAARPRRTAVTVLVVLMVLVAIGGGIALAIIGAMLAQQP